MVELAVSGSDDKTVRIWDLESGACLHTLEGHIGQVRSVSVTPDGRLAVSGSGYAVAAIQLLTARFEYIELENGACVRILEGHNRGKEHVIVTPDGQRAISG